MESKTTERKASLEERLLHSGHEFSFVQAMRLLLTLAGKNSLGTNSQKVRIRPGLDLAFPAADVAGIEKTPDGIPHADAARIKAPATSSDVPGWLGWALTTTG